MKPWLLALRAAIAVCFIALLTSAVCQTDLFALFSELRPAWLLASLLCTVVMVSSSCRKWQLLLELQGGSYSWFHLMRLYLTGYLFTNLLPTSIGGDGIRILYAGRETGSTSSAAVSVFLERGTGLLLVLTLVLVTPWLTPGLVAQPAIQVIMAAALSGWVLFGLFCTGHAVRLLEGTASWCPERWVAAARSFSERLREAGDMLIHQPAVALKVVGWTLFFNVMSWVNVRVTFLALGVDLNWAAIISVVPAAMLAGLLPLSLMGNLGFAEGVAIFMYGLAGCSTEEALAMSLIIRAKLLLLGLAGLFCWWGLGADRSAPTTPPRDPAA